MFFWKRVTGISPLLFSTLFVKPQQFRSILEAKRRVALDRIIKGLIDISVAFES